MIPLDKLERLLHQHDLRLTNPRRVVFEFFSLASEPIQLRAIITALVPLIDRASIYRTVELFERLGVLQEVHRPGRQWLELGERFTHHHHHLTCSGCGLSQALTSPELEQTLTDLGAAAGFRVTGHQVEITGRCGDCLAAERRAPVAT